MHISGNYISAVLFVGALGAASVLSLQAAKPISSEITGSGFIDIVKGKATHAFEEKFGKVAPAYEQSRAAWGVADYVLFREGRDGVVVGDEADGGWLFSSEEFSWNAASQKNIKANLDYVRQVNETLKDKNIPLLVAVIPAKARVFENRLGEFHLPRGRKDLYETIMEYLPAQGIIALDLRAALQSSPGSFLRTDTHWSPEGARLAAVQIADAVRVMAPARGVSTGTTRYTNTLSLPAPKSHSGDLLRYIPLGKFADLGPKPDNLPTYKTEKAAGGDMPGGDLFGDADISYVLVGTSFSANESWNFEGFLKEAIGEDVLNMADEGQGPFATMQAYLESKSFEEKPPRFILWEMPERYFPISEAPSFKE
jgi:alginate O-acetyltransferase complex protein AlgJ